MYNDFGCPSRYLRTYSPIASLGLRKPKSSRRREVSQSFRASALLLIRLLASATPDFLHRNFVSNLQACVSSALRNHFLVFFSSRRISWYHFYVLWRKFSNRVSLQQLSALSLCFCVRVSVCVSPSVSAFLSPFFLVKTYLFLFLFASEEEAASLRFAEDKEEKRWLAVLFPLKAIPRSRAEDWFKEKVE